MSSPVIGLFTCQSEDYIYPVQRGVQDAVRSRGCHLLALSTHDSLQHNAISRESLRTAFPFDRRNIDAAIFAYPNPEIQEHALHLNEVEKLPVILVHREHPRLPHILPETQQAFRQAVMELYRDDHRKILFLGGRSTGSIGLRRDGFLDGLRECGLPYDPILDIDTGLSESNAYSEVQRLLHDRHRFTAIVAADHSTAEGASRAAQDAGFRVPEDVAIIGYDDIPESACADPSLTTFAVPHHSMGFRAGAQIVDYLESGKPIPFRVTCPVRMVHRSSGGLRDRATISEDAIPLTTRMRLCRLMRDHVSRRANRDAGVQEAVAIERLHAAMDDPELFVQRLREARPHLRRGGGDTTGLPAPLAIVEEYLGGDQCAESTEPPRSNPIDASLFRKLGNEISGLLARERDARRKKLDRSIRPLRREVLSGTPMDLLDEVMHRFLTTAGLPWSAVFLFDDFETASPDAAGVLTLWKHATAGSIAPDSRNLVLNNFRISDVLPRELEQWSVITYPLHERGRTMGFLLLDLSNSFQNHFTDIARDITYFLQSGHFLERLQTKNRELHLAKEAAQASEREAEAANRVKSEFLANMSHEIRTPLNSILGLTELTLDTPLNAEQRDFLNNVHHSGEALLDLLNDILDLSRIEAGMFALDPVAFNLWECMDASVAMFENEADRKGIDLCWDMASDVPRGVVGDPVRLRQVLINLLGNAIKFTDEGRVALDVSVEESTEEGIRLRFSVEDTGAGIPQDKQQAIFDPFIQADMSATRTHDGSGLGLTISSRFVKLMEGDLAVESTPGKGSCFTFTAQFQHAPEWKEAIPVAPGVPGTADSPAVRPLRVLLVEDNPGNQKVAERLLERHGHHVDTTRSGEEAVDAVETHRYDAVLMDIQMPGIDGREATSRIRTRERERGVSEADRLPIIAMTAHAMKGVREQCLKAGMNDYIIKPINSKDLFEKLDAYPARADTGTRSPRLDTPQILESFGGSEELFCEVVRILQDEGDRLITAIRDAVENRDREALGFAVHSLKGTLCQFEESESMATVHRLESMTAEADFSMILPLCETLERQVRGVQRAALASVETLPSHSATSS